MRIVGGVKGWMRSVSRNIKKIDMLISDEISEVVFSGTKCECVKAR